MTTERKPVRKHHETVFVPFGEHPLRGLYLTAKARDMLDREVAKGTLLVAAIRKAIERGLRNRRSA